MKSSCFNLQKCRIRRDRVGSSPPLNGRVVPFTRNHLKHLCLIKLTFVRLESRAMNTREQSITLRPATENDQEFLLELYKNSRGDDLRGLGWSEDRIGEFLEMQYEAHQNFLRDDHPGLDDQIVLSDGAPMGHLAFERRANEFRLVDISLAPATRSRGTGTYLIQELQTESAAAKRPLRLQVIRFSRAVGLFERLGFRRTSETGTHFQMEWLPK